MGLKFNGRPFNANDFAEGIEKAMIESAKEQLRERFSAIRHPETGEFPTVIVHGESLDDLRLSIEGSADLLTVVKERMSPEDQEVTLFQPVQKAPPKAFLSYSFEDSELAEKLALGLMAKGIDIWWAEWEIGSGDSLRQKIDEGLGNCTHFLVLLTPVAIGKPWVKLEMDAGLVRRVSGQAKFIPIRYGVSTTELPTLLTGMLSPELDTNNFDAAVRDLANDIHEISSKPQLGPAPATTSLPSTSYSQTATAIAKVFVEETKTAMFADPQKGVDELASAIAASEEDVEDALYELRDFIKLSLNRAMPKPELFAQFDKHFMEWSPEDDALRMAVELVNDPMFPHDTAEVARRYGWDPRRINPALSYLLARNLIVDYKVLSSEFNSIRIVKTDGTRRFVKSRQ
ncbi:toll/interleukin-1 receptor domain-containing protein [Ensifer sp. Root127]|uniref:toll/interleukin-1 receptor domain-containing protein n=1 Tax=Ensifer sp. Root127 TaxID=1736440 RepID=UPI00070BEEC5|nr:toll/interleukin-1 receptor domain-containing protein [Ensifer sp. Root127]KQW72340.1 molecular chaperone Tir [Ensifer sp. Root127]